MPKRRSGVHLWTRVGGPPEAREWIADPSKPFFMPAIHPTALVQSFCTIDGGCERNTKVGARTLLMARVHLGHDAIVGDDVEIGVGSVIGGYAEVKNGAKVGLNVTVLPYRSIGEGATVGAGSVVTKDVPAGETWCGNPARPMTPNATPYTLRSAPARPEPTPGIGLPQTAGGCHGNGQCKCGAAVMAEQQRTLELHGPESVRQ